jgi:isopenicillin N synthase-like dioxygenase
MNSISVITNTAVERFLNDGFVLIKAAERAHVGLRAAFSAGLAFFRSSLEDKMRSRLPKDTGYRPLRGEYSRSALHPDEVESFTTSYKVRNVKTDLLCDSARTLNNRMLALFDILEPIAEDLTISVADKLGVALRNQVLRGAFHLTSLLQLNYSRPFETKAEYINELHEDGCLLTITSVTGPGLEFKIDSESFLPVTPQSDELILMPGEILWLLSGGAVKPIYHRVRPVAAYRERMSLLFFADPHPKYCQPWIVNETNRNVNIGERILKNPTRYGLAEWSLE